MTTEREEPGAEAKISPALRPLEQDELSAVWLFGGVSLESVFGLLAQCPVLSAAPGALLIDPRREERTLYLVLAGGLDVYLEPELVRPVARLTVGESVGELSVIDTRRASAFVVTAADARLLAIDEPTFWRLVAVSHAFAVNLLMLLAQRMRANNQQLSASAQRERILEHQVVTDALTGLYNRRCLDDRLPRLVARHALAVRPLSVLILDIDHFKRFNDELGHAAGDAVLVTVARAVNDHVRPTDLAARYGGEELVVVLPETPQAHARVVAERIRVGIAAARADGVDAAVSVSIGVATLAPGDDASDLLRRADEKLYLAKANGRDRVES